MQRICRFDLYSRCSGDSKDGSLLTGDPLPRFASSATPPAKGGVLGLGGAL
jgi:hypothetical protein